MDLFLVTGSIFLGAFAIKSIYDNTNEYTSYVSKYKDHPQELLRIMTRQRRDGSISEESIEIDIRPQQYPYLDGGVYYGNTDPNHSIGIEEIYHEPYSLNGYTKEIVINNGTRYVSRGVNPNRYKKKHHK